MSKSPTDMIYYLNKNPIKVHNKQVKFKLSSNDKVAQIISLIRRYRCNSQFVTAVAKLIEIDGSISTKELNAQFATEFNKGLIYRRLVNSVEYIYGYDHMFQRLQKYELGMPLTFDWEQYLNILEV